MGPKAPGTPALFTTRSRRPKAAVAAATAPATSASRATSATRKARRPAARPDASSSRVAPAPAFRSQASTDAPRSRRRRVVARPMPLAAPVTSATWPAKVPAGSGTAGLHDHTDQAPGGVLEKLEGLTRLGEGEAGGHGPGQVQAAPGGQGGHLSEVGQGGGVAAGDGELPGDQAGHGQAKGDGLVPDGAEHQAPSGGQHAQALGGSLGGPAEVDHGVEEAEALADGPGRSGEGAHDPDAGGGEAGGRGLGAG